MHASPNIYSTSMFIVHSHSSLFRNTQTHLSSLKITFDYFNCLDFVCLQCSLLYYSLEFKSRRRPQSYHEDPRPFKFITIGDIKVLATFFVANDTRINENIERQA